MSATNSTPTISLPLFIGTDKPAWLTDWNGAMNAIDGAIATLQTAESGTATALAALSQSVTALSGTVEQHTTAIQTVTTATATNTGSINTITSLIGNGEPTTTDKTIIGAINEIYADIGAGDGVDADEVNYDNTQSGLTATDVQAAIDEVYGAIPSVSEAEYVEVATVTADGVKTNAALLTELYNQIAADDVNYSSVLKVGSDIFHVGHISSSLLIFTRAIISTSDGYLTVTDIRLGATSTRYSATNSTTGTNQSNDTPTNGTIMAVYSLK